MTNLKLLKFICICIAVLVSATASAQPVETFFLIPSDTEGHEETAHLHDQGYALKGSRLRLGIQADESSKITLRYSNPAGDEQSFFKTSN